ncbi:hypothetical protein CORC01_13193 [Colletotrichum orchidophilum]|uniref:Uncharacterized protein n=1 Tax=Colletotrichum orchidophilum TaxID=1209926 RepID=A0A1G4AQP5_9PEZI|nr:uncharacterized protein CORC01_13193 [Colletotrichum orchidophilum]OHE91497.1 hypothetical protein CORC01_13193 [Colletotrichum orchidophilum]
MDIAELNNNVTEKFPFTLSDAALEEVAKRFIVDPFHSVGMLQWPNGVLCSAALVGPRHILSAKHWNLDHPILGPFYPGYDNVARFGPAQITNGLFTYAQEPNSSCATEGDWIVYALDQRLGDRLCCIRAKLTDRNIFGKPQFCGGNCPCC